MWEEWARVEASKTDNAERWRTHEEIGGDNVALTLTLTSRAISMLQRPTADAWASYTSVGHAN